MRKRVPVPQMDGLLDELAVPRVGHFARRGKTASGKANGAGFWVRNAKHLDDMLYEIYLAYQRILKLVHPWNGGSQDSYMAVCAAWAKVQRLFLNRGVKL